MSTKNKFKPIFRFIPESDPNWFEKDEVAVDSYGDEVCPVCGCCSLVEAEVAPSIFTQAKQIQSGKTPERRLVCEGGCKKNQRHA